MTQEEKNKLVADVLEHEIDLEFHVSDDPVKNFNGIVKIMKENNIDRINVVSYNDDAKAHYIRGMIEDLKPFIEATE